MGFLPTIPEGVRAKMNEVRGLDKDGNKKKTPAEIFAEAQKARKRGDPLPDLKGVPGEETSVRERPQPKPERWLPGIVAEVEKRSSGWLYSVSYSDLSAKEEHTDLPAKRLRRAETKQEMQARKMREALKQLERLEAADEDRSYASASQNSTHTLDPTSKDFLGYKIGAKVEVWHPEDFGETDEEKAERLKEEAREAWHAQTNKEKFVWAVKKVASEVEKLMVHYGPPYKEEYGGCLYEECNDPKPSIMDIHGLLNEKGDPRVGNKYDHGNTPLHYAARYCNLKLAKMLFRGGAEPKALNELGMSALGTACMFNCPEPRRRTHIQFCRWLIDHGADVNNVDKGGHTALELASSWGNMPLVSMLMQNMARVRRELQFLSIEAPDAVDVAVSEDVKALLIAKKKKETTSLEEDEEERKKKDAALKIAVDLARKKETMLKNIEERKAFRKQQQRLRAKALRESTRLSELEVDQIIEKGRTDRIKENEKKEEESGIWRRGGKRRWRFDRTTAAQAARTNVLEDSGALLSDSKGTEYRRALQARWRSMTGLELTTAHPTMQPRASQVIPESEEAAKPLDLGFEAYNPG